MRSFLIFLALAFLLIVAGFYGCDLLENPQSEYSVVTEEIYQRGWIPRLLPANARQIREQHNMDTNEVWVRYKTITPDFDPTGFGFRLVEHGSWPSEIRRPRHANWWFSSLSQFAPGDAKLFVGACHKSTGHMLVVASEVYLWCEGF